MVRILSIVCFLVAIIGGIWWWRNYHSGSIYDGSVVRRDAAMENGTTTMENGQNLGEAHPTPSRSDAPGTINGDRVDSNGNRYDLGTQTTPITDDPYKHQDRNGSPAPDGSGRSVAPYAPTSSRNSRIGYDGSRSAYGASATDSQTPYAPDGQRFGGDGAFQLYRQGNLTFRVDTRTGRSCVLYATTEEWRKPAVYRNGCHV